MSTTKNDFQKTFSHIIFDLDGTLSDPGLGVKNSFLFAFKKLSIEFDIDSQFSSFIGPPLHKIFSDVLGWDDELTEKGVTAFREYYGKKGVYENSLYKGISGMLKDLNSKGKKLYLATSKLEKYAIEVLKYHNIYKYFTFISGASYKGTGAEKTYLIEQVLAQINLESREEIIMVGDRNFDIEAANDCGIDSIGVLYGFGGVDELTAAGASYIIETPETLNELLNSVRL